ncbi:type III secretion system outer membrane ring subunit SctC [Paracidovorax valerianellae]|uniref:Type 3 secretion system secretin n=1 Tax=Paracidovorax valerianellae TaxID=187868 RepID=A0A1G6Z8M7_9BURK|nr:type III secretion system outer membrane ring subunit SctC [Paracidovorax valerianellae]MDA8445703.1 type III secretion system outer membrane ring subunit SctC [Paracidovorax valerianellae]SDD98136.1 type III secretion protein C [Paracidovorax valerianellae]
MGAVHRDSLAAVLLALSLTGPALAQSSAGYMQMSQRLGSLSGLPAAASPFIPTAVAETDKAAASAATRPVATPSARATSLSAGKALPLPMTTTEQAPWEKGRFVYRAENKRISDVLQDFAASRGTPAIVADGVEGVVNANFDLKPREFLDSISRAYNLLWYHDGTALYFYPGRAMQSRMFRLKGFDRDQVAELLQSFDLGDKRYPIRFNETSSTLYASGPPRHLELVSSALEALDAGVSENNSRTVRVFTLQFASAGDRPVGNTTAPGVTTMLRKLYGEQEKESSSNASLLKMMDKDSDIKRKKLGGYVPLPAANQFLPPLPRATNQDASTPASDLRPLTAPEKNGDDEAKPPRFEADEGTNSVVVYGKADLMPEIEKLIRRLDQKPQLVELEATIIEVNSDSVDALGVNWTLRGSDTNVSMNLSNSLMPAAALGTIVADAGRHLLARVNALQGEGKARILSKPSVMGVANRTAVMREKRVATVRVAGNLEANLFQIEAGTLLEMTPQVTRIDGGNSVKLTLYIEDGAFETNLVDQVPIVKKTEIRTEAHVREGESLLIGGITVESEQSQINAVPGLSKLPLVGGAFRNTDRQTQRTERLFLITPRLLSGASPSPVALLNEVRKP